jgi:spore germination cell wall hydrolase CwlJ-like protein
MEKGEIMLPNPRWFLPAVFLYAMLFFCVFAHADDSKAVLTIIYEARGESFEGQVMVASVIKTRAYIKNKTSEEIVTKPYQFSCWDKNGKPVQKHTPTSKEIETALRAWKVAEIGVYTNYYATWIKPPSWSWKCTHKKTIGKHVFCHLENF